MTLRLTGEWHSLIGGKPHTSVVYWRMPGMQPRISSFLSLTSPNLRLSQRSYFFQQTAIKFILAAGERSGNIRRICMFFARLFLWKKLCFAGLCEEVCGECND